MTDRYVGPGGNDGNSGLTWALRKLTLNGVEDTPVVAGDTVYVGPGVYRETLTIDVPGSSGSIITYIADVTGEHTDGVGGIVRVTGSDNDQSATRARCIDCNGKDYRTFRGFHFDTVTGNTIYIYGGSDHITIEDCFAEGYFYNGTILVSGTPQSDVTIRRCVFIGSRIAVNFVHSADVSASNHLVENCLIIGMSAYGVNVENIGDVTVRNCTILGANRGIMIGVSVPAGEQTIVNNCIIAYCQTGLQATATSDMTEDYNTFWGNITDRTSVNTGANSQAYPPLLLPPLLHSGASQASGYTLPWWFGELSEWSQVRAITGSNEPSVDLQGIGRPATASKNSWGALQFHDMERDTGTTRGGSTASIKLADAGRHQIWVPVANESTTISVYVYREANYAGTLPQMIIKQPGQSDRTTTDTGSASQWNQLSDTFTPSADTDFVVVELVSNNTATSGNYDVFFDDLAVS